MDLDDELRRLFAESGDRLDVPIRPDAEQVIVAGVRRVRRRRVATATASGAVAAVAVIVGGIVLAGGAPDAMPPAASSSATSTTTSLSVSGTASSPVLPSLDRPPAPGGTQLETTTEENTEGPQSNNGPPAPPKLNFEILGPTGVRALHLGQSFEDAKATGMLKFGDELVYPPCTAYRVLLDGREIAFTYISLPESGNQVELISTSELQTPEGVGAGWTPQQIADVYPAFDASAAKPMGSGSVAVPGNPAAAYQFWFEADGRLSGFNLRRIGQQCDTT